METLPANMELGPRLRTSELTTAAAAWQVLGLLLSLGRPAGLSELVSSVALSYLTPEFIRLLCFIPNSPIRFVDNQFVTFSEVGFAAIARFFANSDFITRNLDLQQFVPRFLANVGSNGVVRTYCRKRKRPILEIEDFPLMKRKSYLQYVNEDRNPNQMVRTMPRVSQSVYTQGIETLSRLSQQSEYDCWKLEKIVFRPLNFSKSRSGRFSYENENAEHECGKIEVEIPNMERFSDLGGCKSCTVIQGGSSHIHRIVEEELINSAPLSELSVSPEGSRICGIDIVNPINSVNTCTPSKLEVDARMTVTQEKTKAVIQGWELLSEDVNVKLKEVFLHDSEGRKGYEESQLMDRTHEDGYHIHNPKKTLHESNNKAHLVRSRTEGYRQSERSMLNHLIQSSVQNPNHKDETCDGKKAICTAVENCKDLPDKGPQEFNRAKNPTLEKKMTKFNCEKNMDTNEKRETSKEKKGRPSSIDKNIEQKPFPDFESFIVEEEEGSGGYGTVYRARRKADGVIFAIKCPHVNANRNYVCNEIKMLERLGGKNFVIKYEGSFKSGNADCLVLEHVKHDRPEILKKEMNVTDIQWYGYCLFKALAGLHKQGIVHRDVKPGNFLYSRKINKGYLIDFNLALDMRKKHGTSDAVNKNAGKVSRSLLPPGNLKKKVDKRKLFTDGSNSRNIIKSQGADGSGITSAKDATSTRTLSGERLRVREPLPSQGRKVYLSLAQEAMLGANHESINAPKSKRKRVAAPSGSADSKFLYTTPMPLHANGIAIRGAGLLKSKGDGKSRHEGPCVGTKGFKAPEALFRSLHQGPKADIWSAGVTLLYLMIGRTPFIGDTDHNIKEIAKLRGSEDLWEVAKLHNNEQLFPTELLDEKYLFPVNFREWCGQNTRRTDFIEAIPKSLFDLVDKCLTVNPRQRFSAEEALQHDFFAPCHETVRKHRLQKQGLH